MILEKDDEVSHMVGSSEHRGNWKKFWIKESGKKWPKECRIFGCGNPATVGAHVYVKFSRQIFILPTCQECNRDPDQEFPNRISVKAKSVVVRTERHPNTFETEPNQQERATPAKEARSTAVFLLSCLLSSIDL